MGDKPIEAVPGIESVYLVKLKEKGYEKAYHLLAQFLIVSKDETIFETWFESEIGMINEKCLKDISGALSEWCKKNL